MQTLAQLSMQVEQQGTDAALFYTSMVIDSEVENISPVDTHVDQELPVNPNSISTTETSLC